MLRRNVSPLGPVYYTSPLLSELRIPHAFSTRLGGVSAGPFATLNLGNPLNCLRPDSLENIEENYRLLAASIGCESRERVSVHQVHGCTALDAADVNMETPQTQADAILTADPTVLLSVRVADCVPVLLATIDGRHVAAIHAGWRGIIAGVVAQTVAQLRLRTQLSLVAAIGPSIGFEAFEVGDDVLAPFINAFAERSRVCRRQPDGKGHIDLKRAAASHLADLGLTAADIEVSDLCTAATRDEFFSHRRDGNLTGRMAALISPATT